MSVREKEDQIMNREDAGRMQIPVPAPTAAPVPLPAGKAKDQLSAAQLRKIRNRNRTLLHAGLQIVFFISMPGAFVAGFNGVKYIFRQMGAGSPLEWNSFVLALVGLAAFTMVFGRFFCGFACAFGALGDLVYWLSSLFQARALKKRRAFVIPQSFLPWLQKLKYINLAFIILMTVTGAAGRLQGTSPWDVFSRFTALRLPDAGLAAGCVFFVLILIGMGVHSRFFCQFLCPMGAVFAILPVLPFTPLSRDPEGCLKGCSACKRLCPAGLQLEPDGRRNGECVCCERCAGVCPKNNIGYPGASVIRNETAYVLLCAVLLFVLGICLGLCRFLPGLAG